MSESNLKTKTRLAMGDLLDRILGGIAPAHPATPARALDLSELEDRILLSASPMMVVAEMADAAPADSMTVETATLDSDVATPSQTDSSTSTTSSSSVTTDPSQIVTHEIVFLDTGVEDYQQLLDDLWSNDDPTREIAVVLLSSLRDGIDQISEALASRSDLDSIHIVSHGTDAAVKLGSTWLTPDNLAGYVGEIARWGDALSADADLLFYGCDLAATSEGQDLIDSLAVLTGADVAASNDDTGHAIFGADWDLEYATGDIETAIAFSESTQSNWGHIMNVTVDATSTGTTTGSTINITHTTSGTDRLMLVAVSFARAEGATVGSITYNVDALSFVGAQENADGRARVEIWSLVAPDLGTDLNLVVNFAGGSGSEGATAGVITFNGVDQSTALGSFASAEGTSTAASTSVSSADGEVVFGAVAVRGIATDYDLSPGAGQTEQFDAFISSANGGGSIEAGAASVTTSWTWGGTSNRWAIGGVSIKAAPDITSGLILHTTFDVDATDSSGNNYDGTLTGDAFIDPTNATDRVGVAKLSLDGTGDYVDLDIHAASFASLTDGTISAWIKLTDPTESTIFSLSDSGDTLSLVKFGVQSGQLKWLNLNDAANDVIAYSTQAVNDGLWHHVALTVSGGGNTLYIDGTEASVSYTTGNATTAAFFDDINDVDSLSIGRSVRAGTTEFEFDGLIDDARIYGRALSAGDITELFSYTGFTNSAPTTSDSTVATDEDAIYTFAVADFNYSDADSDPLDHVQITALESVGSLKLSGVDVTFGQTITAADITAGNLKFTPISDQNGTGYDSFEFRVNDGTEYSEAASTVSLLAATFDANAEGFIYADDVLGTALPGFADGTYEVAGGQTGGGLKVALAGAITGGATSGGWQDTFNLASDGIVTVSLDYRLVFSSEYEATEFGEAVLLIDGVRYGSDTNTSLRYAIGDGNGGVDDDSGWLSESFEIALSAGGHTITLAAYNNDATAADVVEAYFDNVSVDQNIYNTMTLDVTAVNDAPVLDFSGSSSLTTITEDDINNSGNTVAQIIASAGGDRITDIDTGAQEGIAIFNAPSGNGSWEYSINAGSNWSSLGAVSSASSLLLRDIDLVRFTPNGDTGTSANIGFRAWDQTSGSAGSKVSTSVNGGTTAFSSTSEVATITVTSVNDAPTITSDGGGASAALNIAENTTAVTTVTSSDVDGGTPVYSIAGGADAAKFAINSSSGALTFVSAPDFESPTDVGVNNVYDVTVQVSDGTFTDTQSIAVTVTALNDNTPTITSDGGGASATLNVAENATAVTTVTATDADLPGDTLTYSISGGADSGKFSINGTTGDLTFAVAPDFETPTDVGTDNVYGVIVEVSDGTFTDTQSIAVTVTVTAVNDNTPTITSDGGGASAALNVAENSTVVTTVTATDADLPAETLSYSISGGADSGKFSINGTTGDLTFAVAPDFEVPTDVGTDNVYDVIVEVSDGTFTDTQSIAVTVTAVNDNTPTITSDGGGASAALNVAENSTAVTTVTATDADLPGDTLTYSISGGADSGKFSINGTTGDLTFAVAPDFETPTDVGTDNVYDVTVQVSDGTLIDTQAISVTVTDVDEFDVTIPTDSDGIADAVNENAANGTAVGITGFATDADATTNGVTYSLFDNAGGRFAIDGSSGVVTVADGSQLNREAAASHNITVRATSADGSTADTVFTVNLNDLDEFDTGAVTDIDGTGNSVAEDAIVGTVVGVTASASDDDATTNTITYTLDDDAGGLFAIHSGTGVVTGNAALDYETATSHNVIVRATSADTSFSTQSFSITVTDVNEGGVSAISDTDGTADLVAENSANGTAVGVTAFASDPDGTDSVSYSLDDNASGRFAIDTNTVLVTVAAGLDREAAASYDITVRATSTDTSFTTKAFTIAIGDVDDFDVTAPTDTDGTADAVNENAANGTAVGITGFATDDDATTNGVTYSLFDDAGGRFAIDSSTGIVTVADGTQLNREADATHDITIRATSDDGSTDDTTFTIAINDVDEFEISAISDSDATLDNVDENATVGTTAFASDADATTNGVTYSLDDDATGQFAIDGSSGLVTVAGAIDREAGATRTITVRATSDDASFSTKDFTIAINDLDEFDISAISDADATLDNVDENATVGTTVGVTAFASDGDATTDGVTYSLDDDSTGQFAINGSSGLVTVAGAIDREAGATRTITVRATSDDGSFSTKDFTIAINDLNDNAPIISVGQTFEVSEFASNGDGVGTATATDVDTVGVIQNWAITSGNVDGVFEVDAASGEIRVADNSLLNFETTATYVLSLRVEDGANTSSTQTVTVNVVDENDVPVLNVNAGLPVVEGGDVIISSAELEVSDEDELPSDIRYTVVDSPSASRLELTSDPGVSIATFTQADIDNNLLRFVHDGSEADDSFTFSISDGSGGTIGTTLFSISNLRVNDAPVNSTPASQTTNEDTPLVFSSGAGNGISVSDVDLNGGLIGIRLVATNGTLTLASTSGLVFASGNGSNDSDLVFAGLIDDVNDALKGLKFAPNANYNGPATVRVITRDMGSSGSGGEQIDDDTINITVTAVNDNPVAADDEYSTSEDNALTVTVASGLLSNDSDIDGDALTVVAVSVTTNGALSLNGDGSFVYTPNANFNGVDSFTYHATDGSLQSETRTVTLNVSAVNDASVSVDDEFTIDQMTVLELSAANGVLVNDLDVEADALQAVLVDGPQHGRLVLNADGSLTYTPTATFFGEDTFTYRSVDGSDDGSIGTVRIVVRQTVTSGGDGDVVIVEESDTTDGDETNDSGESDNGTGVSGDDAVDGSVDSDPGETSTTPTIVSPTDTSGETTDTTRNVNNNDDDGQSTNGSENEQPTFVAAFRVDERGELRDRVTGRIVEDAGVVVFTSTDVGSMVYVLEQTGFWTELDTFEQDVQASILQEGEWEELVVETTTVAGTTLTVGYIVWLLRSGSIVFGLVSSLPAWTMMDPLPVLQSGLEGLGDTDNFDDDSLQGILQAHHDGTESPAESFEE